ncbi:hypothetical protein IJH23_03555 [Candidatus Saccharibacteria bacterium]|nr:hypothetical protein [Candidatus Saccharibacteria bacterium]
MTRRGIFGIGSVLVLSIVSGFVCSPVFAGGPVDIEIVEVVDDGSGVLKPWEDIVGAMPGESYSAIPRVKNNGEVEVSVKMCLSQSATDGAGNSIMLPNNTFGILVNESWTLESSETDAVNPATGNCYIYNSKLEVGEVTEPLFTEVSLSSEFGNEYRNNTFSLHLEAEARDGEAPEPTPTPSPEPTPESPNTGVNSVLYLEIVSPVFYTAGVIGVFALIAYFLRRIWHKK